MTLEREGLSCAKPVCNSSENPCLGDVQEAPSSAEKHGGMKKKKIPLNLGALP